MTKTRQKKPRDPKKPRKPRAPKKPKISRKPERQKAPRSPKKFRTPKKQGELKEPKPRTLKDSKHHRRPHSIGGTDHSATSGRSNFSMVTVTKHRAWHTLFVNYTPQKIADIINKIWLDPDWKFVVVPR